MTRGGKTPIMSLMSSLAFDTLKAAKALREAGFDDAQAEAVIATVGDAVSGNVATKTDIAELRVDMLKIGIGIVVANVTLTIALLKLLP